MAPAKSCKYDIILTVGFICSFWHHVLRARDCKDCCQQPQCESPLFRWRQCCHFRARLPNVRNFIIKTMKIIVASNPLPYSRHFGLWLPNNNLHFLVLQLLSLKPALQASSLHGTSCDLRSRAAPAHRNGGRQSGGTSRGWLGGMSSCSGS